jgi:ribosomal protein L30
MAKEKQIKVTLIRSVIGQKPDKRATVRSLGLKKISSSNIGPIKTVTRICRNSDFPLRSSASGLVGTPPLKRLAIRVPIIFPVYIRKRPMKKQPRRRPKPIRPGPGRFAGIRRMISMPRGIPIT